MKLFALALASLLVFGAAAHAADSDALPASPPCMKDGAAVPDDYVQLARDVLVASKSSDRMTQILDAILPSIVEIARKSNPGLSQETAAELQAAVREEMLKSLPQLISATACIYVEHFSRDELTQLVLWYKSPLAQKMMAEAPGITREALPLGKAWGEEAGRAAVGRVMARYRNKGEHT